MEETATQLFTQILREEDGQDMVEYVLITGLISIIAITAITATGTGVRLLWESISEALVAVMSGP